VPCPVVWQRAGREWIKPSRYRRMYGPGRNCQQGDETDKEQSTESSDVHDVLLRT